MRVLADWVVVHHLGGSVGELPAAAPATLEAGDASPGVDGQRLDLLWLDLLQWARRHRCPAWARRARRVLIVGGRLRQLRLTARRFDRRAAREALAVAAAAGAEHG